MDWLVAAWTFITSHWPNVVTILSAIKPTADTIDSVKKVLPKQLESKQLTQEYVEKSADLLNDQSIPVEDKRWELETRQELAKSMVQLTAIDAAYHVASAAVVVAFATVMFNYLARIFARRKEP